MQVSGTKEWAEHSVNIYYGCAHDCRYCYARQMAVRFGRATRESWKTPRLRTGELARPRRQLEGTVMFPTTHDITPATLGPCLAVLQKLLAAGNRVLVVSKPHLECIRTICHAFEERRDQVLFRFTIGADTDRFLSYWEPGAPPFAERLDALEHAHDRGFFTSVSAEPCLDFAHADRLIETLLPFVTDAVWIGKMNKPMERVIPRTPDERTAVEWIKHAQRDEVLLELHARHRDNPQVKWKESIKQVVGLPLADRPGLDV